MEQVKIRSYSKNLNKCEEVALANNFFFIAYKRWSGKDNIGDDIIKVMMPSNIDIALKMCLDGITIDNIKYIAYTSTPSMQKKEDNFVKKSLINDNWEDVKCLEICDMWFIKEDKKEFNKWFENLISLGTIEKFKNQEICINKKVTSRIGLAFTSTEKIDFKPRICIVPNKIYKELTEDVIWYTNENNKLVEHTEDNKNIEIMQNDGFGIFNNRTARTIQKQLGYKENIDVTVIRMYGIAVKGLCIRFNWIDYIEKYCNGKFFTTDVWGNKVDLRKVDIILTESMVKWWDNFESLDDYFDKLNKCVDKDLLECLYVKVEKDKHKEYTLANYQLLSNLTLDYDDYMNLAQETIYYYNNIIDGDLAHIKHFMSEFSYDEVDNKDLVPQHKANYLLNAHDDFIRSSVVKQNINRAILKSVARLSSGKFYLKGNCKFICGNPFQLIDFLLGKDRITLDKEEFYIPRNNGKKLTMSRNPLASPWEIVNIQTVNNPLFDEYFKHYTDKIIFFNDLDYTSQILSGCDKDGDTVTVIENDIIYNNVITDERKFIYVDEGKTVNMIYNDENKFKALLLSSGNKIGQLALINSSVSNNSLHGNKQDIYNNFYDNRGKLLYLTWAQMSSIDAPKNLKFPTNKDLEIIEKQDKPLFLKYKDGYNDEIKKTIYTDSHYDRFAKYIIENVLKKCLDKCTGVGTNMLKNYIYTEDVEVSANCADDMTKILKEYSNDMQDGKGNLDICKRVIHDYQDKAQKISDRYNYDEICNYFVKHKTSDKAIINLFWNELIIKLNEVRLSAKVLKPNEHGEYLFFGKWYSFKEVELIEDNLHTKDMETKANKYELKGKEGIINVGICEIDLLKGELDVKLNIASTDIYKDNKKITFAYSDIKDTNGKKTNDSLKECKVINILEVLDTKEKYVKLKIAY